MNNELISLSDESLDQVAGGALITFDVTGTVKGLFGAAASIGEAVYGLGGAVVKAGGQIVKAVGTAVGAVVEIK